MNDFEPYMHPSARPEPCAQPSPESSPPPSSGPPAMSRLELKCANCGTRSARQFYRHAAGTLCLGCYDAKTAAEQALANAPTPAQLAHQEAERAKQREFSERIRALPEPPTKFCEVLERHHRSVAVAVVAGRLACEECCPIELNPAKLAERLAAVEAQLAGQATKSTTRKASS
jgi:hypothetical protein